MDITCVTIDSRGPEAIARFWGAALGWDDVRVVEGGVAAVCRPSHSHTGSGADRDIYLEFVRVPEPKTIKNRLHLGCSAASLDVLDAEIERLTGLGATFAWEEEFGPTAAAAYRNVIMRDPEGNEFCVGAGTMQTA